MGGNRESPLLISPPGSIEIKALTPAEIEEEPVVRIGSWVELLYRDRDTTIDKRLFFRIIPQGEKPDIYKKGTVSAEAPLAQNILGLKVGETVEFPIAGGKGIVNRVTAKVLGISALPKDQTEA